MWLRRATSCRNITRTIGLLCNLSSDGWCIYWPRDAWTIDETFLTWLLCSLAVLTSVKSAATQESKYLNVYHADVLTNPIASNDIATDDLYTIQAYGSKTHKVQPTLDSLWKSLHPLSKTSITVPQAQPAGLSSQTRLLPPSSMKCSQTPAKWTIFPWRRYCLWRLDFE